MAHVAPTMLLAPGRASGRVRRGLQRGIVLTALLALLAPGAVAGDEDDPEVDDARDFRDASLDLLAAWFSPDPSGVRLTIKVAELDEDLEDHVYFASFTLHGERHLAAVGFDGDGGLHGHVGPPPSSPTVRGIETFDDNLADLRVRTGAPGYVSAVIPYDEIDGLEPGAVLVDIVGGTSLYHRDRGIWESNVDVRGTDRTYTVQRVLLDPVATRWIVGGSAVLALAGLGVVGLVVVKRRRPSAPPSAPVPVQAPPPPPPPPREPPKPRFSLRPPR